LLGKIKTLLKVLVVSMVMVLILFGIYRREYLSQAIPVYMQYLEQKSKWDKLNTGTYVYFSPRISSYYFIKNNNLVKTMRSGNPYKPKFVKNLNQSFIWDKAKESKYLSCYFKNNEYLIEKRFDAVWRFILIEKLTGSYASLTKCNFHFSFSDLFRRNNDDSYEIGYNQKYGYPMIIDNRSAIIPSSSDAQALIMLPQGTQYTNKVLKQILDYYEHKNLMLDKYKIPKVPIVDIVGGNLIKSAILDTNETFRFPLK